jgi:acyl-CoA thioesterase FadM
MYLWFRLARVVTAAHFGQRLDVLDTSVLRFRVLPHDLDLNIHMNNARYLALMDLGRVDLMIRCGLWRAVTTKRRHPIIAGALVRFRRALRPFQSFTLSSRALCWDERWIYIEHRIETKDAPACLTVVRGAFLEDGAIMPISRLMSELGIAVPSPPVPDWIDRWNAAEGMAFENGMSRVEIKEPDECDR